MLSSVRHLSTHGRLLRLSQSCLAHRTYVTTPTAIPNAELPDHSQWRNVFPCHNPFVRDRVSVANPATASRLANAFLTGKSPAAGKNKIVVEAFPGPGCLSRALMKLNSDQLKKLIILEDYEPYLEYLRPLEKMDPRVRVVEKSGHDWETYEYLEENGYLDDVEKASWDSGLHPNLHFISHIPHTIKGEQLVAQLFRAIPERMWLFKFGRVPMSFILGEWMWQRLSAPENTATRCKVSVISQAAAELKPAVVPGELLPYDEHFHPRTLKMTGYQEKKPESRRLGHPLTALNVIPWEDQIIDKGMLDKWDYVLRRLFVLKSTPLKKSMLSLSPGSLTLNKMITDPRLPPEERVDIGKSPKKLTLSEWALILRAFDNWPFAPQDLFITDGLSKMKRE